MRYLVILLLLAGCSTIDLPPEYHPLKTVREGLTPSSTTVWTFGDTVTVSNLDKYKDLSNPIVKSVLAHERDHAFRQKEMGKWSWSRKYFTNKSFRKQEELRGWYFQLKALQAQGQTVHPPTVAKILSRNYMNMMGYQEAEQWVVDVLNNKWRPDAQ